MNSSAGVAVNCSVSSVIVHLPTIDGAGDGEGEGVGVGFGVCAASVLALRSAMTTTVAIRREVLRALITSLPFPLQSYL